MKPITVLTAALLLVASVHGGSRRFVRSSGKVADGSERVVINMEGLSEAVGEGSSISEHGSQISVVGTPAGWTPSTPGGWNQPEVPGGWAPGQPATLNLNTGSGSSLYQSASNYQQSNINADGSSNAYQGNSGSNSAYGYDYIGADAQGSQINADTTGLSATSGSGTVAQVDLLNHTSK